MFWLVEHPTHQYKEDVKALALASGLEIIDINHRDSILADLIEKKPPKLTKKTAVKTGAAE